MVETMIDGKNRRIGPPADGSKPPRRRRGERLAISAVHVLIMVAIGLAIMGWLAGWW